MRINFFFELKKGLFAILLVFIFNTYKFIFIDGKTKVQFNLVSQNANSKIFPDNYFNAHQINYKINEQNNIYNIFNDFLGYNKVRGINSLFSDNKKLNIFEKNISQHLNKFEIDIKSIKLSKEISKTKSVDELIFIFTFVYNSNTENNYIKEQILNYFEDIFKIIPTKFLLSQIEEVKNEYDNEITDYDYLIRKYKKDIGLTNKSNKDLNDLENLFNKLASQNLSKKEIEMSENLIRSLMLSIYKYLVKFNKESDINILDIKNTIEKSNYLFTDDLQDTFKLYRKIINKANSARIDSIIFLNNEKARVINKKNKLSNYEIYFDDKDNFQINNFKFSKNNFLNDRVEILKIIFYIIYIYIFITLFHLFYNFSSRKDESAKKAAD